MSKKMIEQNLTSSFYTKYKKRIMTVIGISLIPSVLFICTIIGTTTYLFINNDTNWHPYKSYIEKGYRVGFKDGKKERGHLDTKTEYLSSTPWNKYQKQTEALKKQATEEKEKYLEQFPESTRGTKRAEMSINNVEFSLTKELKKRFTSGNDFYADHVKKIVIRGVFHTEEEYQQALRDEAWKLGYEYGYARGWWNDIESYGLVSLTKN